jgi:putative copper resistance protein D
MILTGSSLFLVYAFPASGAAVVARARWPRRLLVVAALLLAATALLGIGAQSVVLSGSLADGIKPETLSAVVSGMDLGKAGIVRAAAALTAAVLLMLLRPSRTSWIGASFLGSIATASLAWMGHGAATEGPLGKVHLASDMLHAVAAAVWIGALIGFFGLLAGPRGAEANDALYVALRRFSGVGSALVAVLVATGLVNSWILIGPDRIESLWTTSYGQLLSLKVVLFVGMLGLAAGNRFRLTPALARANASRSSEAALLALRRSITLEALLGFGVLFLVAWFGTLAPPASG